jgi:hypothetical protein
MLAGNSLAFLAYQQASTTRPSVELATASYDTAEHDASPRVRALLLERLAWTHAVAGSPAETDGALPKPPKRLPKPAPHPSPTGYSGSTTRKSRSWPVDAGPNSTDHSEPYQLWKRYRQSHTRASDS